MRAHPQFELLLALTTVWLVLVAHARAAPPLAILGVELERPPPPLAPEPLAPLAPLGLAPSLPAPSVTPVVAATARAVDPAPQRILMLGDSMVERLMGRFADYCEANGHRLTPAIWYASTTTGWSRDEKLGQLLRETDPSFVIVVLGSSELTMRGVQRIEGPVRRIVERIGPRKLIWVGPPNWREDSGINALLRRLLGDGHFFRSADLSFERAADGIHPSWDSAADWMDAIARWIREVSDVPIRLEPPSTPPSPRRPKARVFAPPR
ncbi:MAG: hypothetical protein R3B72_17745 [Polyangiaceae bacterium]